MISTIVAMVVVLDPFGLTRLRPRRFEVGLAVLAAGGAAVVLAQPVLDVLDLSPEGFWIAAGVLLFIPAFGRIGRAMNRDVVGPAPVAVAMALATRDGTGAALVGVTVAAAIAVLLSLTDPPKRAQLVQNLIGAAMIVLALDLIRDGVIAV